MKRNSDKEVEFIAVEASELAIEGISETGFSTDKERLSWLVKELYFSLVSELLTIPKTKLSFPISPISESNSEPKLCLSSWSAKVGWAIDAAPSSAPVIIIPLVRSNWLDLTNDKVGAPSFPRCWKKVIFEHATRIQFFPALTNLNRVIFSPFQDFLLILLNNTFFSLKIILLWLYRIIDHFQYIWLFFHTWFSLEKSKSLSRLAFTYF